MAEKCIKKIYNFGTERKNSQNSRKTNEIL